MVTTAHEVHGNIIRRRTIAATDNLTVDTLLRIQENYEFNLSWVGDPCSPTPWKRVMCLGNTVISLDLSNMNLSALIVPVFGDLMDLQSLDLHNNTLLAGIDNLVPLTDLQVLNLSFNLLNGAIPDLIGMDSLQTLDLQHNRLGGTLPTSLGSLPVLKELNVENNSLIGPVPSSLNRSSLILRTSGNPCINNPCNQPSAAVVPPSLAPLKSRTPASPSVASLPKRKDMSVIVGGSIGGALAFLLILGILLINLRRTNRKDMLSSSSRKRTNLTAFNGAKRFSLKEVKKATGKFKDPIGHGSFGPVYLGKLVDGQRVAVKVRSDTSEIGCDSFVNEVFLLSQLQHQNLVSLIGFCLEANQQILIYEYLPGGAFNEHLYGKKAKRRQLSWKKRLQIVVGAASGLEYLHEHNPRIIHRDVKTNNILLDAEWNAKVSDFGLSKHLEKDDTTHVTTMVKGTAGYLDPEYYETQQLTEKSDVYSFGVVLLEIICGREPLSQDCPPDEYNLVFWARSFLERGSYGPLVDKSLENSFSLKSMETTVLLAAWCLDRVASKRPSMHEIVKELKSALTIEQECTDSLSTVHSASR